MARKNESGQALVLVLLSLAVVLTLVLFILSRSITDIAVSSSQEESVRAFSAAEAGIERALVIGSSLESSANGFSYTAVVSGFSAGTYDFSFPSPLLSGDTMTTWFVGHDSSGKLVCDASNPETACFEGGGDEMKICWGNAGMESDNTFTPAIELSVYYETTPGHADTMRVGRAAFDPNSSRAQNYNSFSLPDPGTCQIGSTTYQFQKTLTFSSLGIPAGSYQNPNGLVLARARILYNTNEAHALGTTFDFAGNSKLPSQGEGIVSTGTAGQSNRRISVFQGWAESPFEGNAVVSPLAITK